MVTKFQKRESKLNSQIVRIPRGYLNTLKLEGRRTGKHASQVLLSILMKSNIRPTSDGDFTRQMGKLDKAMEVIAK